MSDFTLLPSPTPTAKVIADSISPDGYRLTSVQAVIHRFVLAELNTHRVFSRNSASSRAIPVAKQLERFQSDPWFPMVWTSEQPGMQGGVSLEGGALTDAQRTLRAIQFMTSDMIKRYLDKHPDPATRLHKSLLNRPMEWAQSHTVLITSTAWDGFYAQRVSPLAQPEFDAAARAIKAAIDGSAPTPLGWGQWHTPYIQPDEKFADWMQQCQVSAARCARTSFLTQEGVRDFEEDLRLYLRLATANPMHASPLEHVARPSSNNSAWAVIEDFDGDEVLGRVQVPLLGNFLGYRQLRHMVTGEF